MTSASSDNTSSQKKRELEKRADALRENLMKRKQQARAKDNKEKK